MLKCYTDGACIGKPGQRRGGFGVFWPHNETWCQSQPLEPSETAHSNQRSELRAILAALQVGLHPTPAMLQRSPLGPSA